MNCFNSRCVLLCAALASLPAPATAQQKAKPAEEYVVKVYRVIDLVLPAPNYPYEGTHLPAMGEAGSPGPDMTGGMGGMMGGMGGVGGGMFQIADQPAKQGGTGKPRGGGGGGGGIATGANSARLPASTRVIDMDDLIEVITGTVEPSSWNEVGGEGSIVELGATIAVRQTPAVHAEIQELLDALARESGMLRMITIRARWLSLDGGQLAQLVTASDPKQPAAAQTVDPKALAALAPEAERYAGQITCFNGQTVHMISGRIETVINGVIPVVGPEVGYQPVMLSPHLGVLLQVKPSALPNGEGVLVDLQSTITRWGKTADSARIGTTPERGVSINVDRLSATAQQFATSLRMPLDKPVLVGGMSEPQNDNSTADAQAAEKAEAARGLYLVIEVHASST